MMQNFKDIDFNSIWQETMGWNISDKSGRKFDDQVESNFWVQLAPHYTKEYDLNKDTDLIADRLSALLGTDRTILEIGCGSGNFTALMARYSRSILGLDFSPAMLAVLEERRLAEDIGNIRTQAGKWDDFTTDAVFDYIVSVNSLYRIRDMQKALLKMQAYSRCGFIIVRTIQRPFFFDLYTQNSVACAECPDYQLLPLLLWRSGIQANVEFITYPKKKHFLNLADVSQEMQADLTAQIFHEQQARLLQAFTGQAAFTDGRYTISQPRTTVIISVKK